jgi:hypothetical protein
MSLSLPTILYSLFSLLSRPLETPELPLWLQVIMRDGRFRTFCGPAQNEDDPQKYENASVA